MSKLYLMSALWRGHTVALLQLGAINTHQEHSSSLTARVPSVPGDPVPSFALQQIKRPCPGSCDAGCAVYHLSICSNLRQTRFCHTQRVSFRCNYIIGFLALVSPNVGYKCLLKLPCYSALTGLGGCPLPMASRGPIRTLVT